MIPCHGSDVHASAASDALGIAVESAPSVETAVIRTVLGAAPPPSTPEAGDARGGGSTDALDPTVAYAVGGGVGVIAVAVALLVQRRWRKGRSAPGAAATYARDGEAGAASLGTNIRI